MIESVKIAETVIARIIRRINVDELHFAREAFCKRMKRHEIVAFYQEILFELSIFIPKFYVIRIFDIFL